MTPISTVQPLSRRSILSTAAKIAAAGALTGLAAAAPRASTAGAAKEDRQDPRPDVRNAGDAAALTILLQIERRQIALYTGYVRRFGLDESTSGDRFETGHAQIHQILRQEKRHAAELEAALVAAGGEPPLDAPTAPTFADPIEFHHLAAEIESEAVAAYVGALATISEPESLAIGLGILAVEARQAAVLGARAGLSPLADDLQPALSRQDLEAFFAPASNAGDSPLLTVED